jgi:hypothetical protein
MAEGMSTTVAPADDKPHVVIKLGAQRKRGGKTFNYNGPAISDPLHAVFEVHQIYNKRETIKYNWTITLNCNSLGEKIPMVLNKLASVKGREYHLHITLTDSNGNTQVNHARSNPVGSA